MHMTPYALLAAKIRDWTPPDGMSVKRYDARSGVLGLTFKVVLSCQCEVEERLSLLYMISHDQWEDLAISRDVIVEGILARMYEEADQKMAEHAAAGER